MALSQLPDPFIVRLLQKLSSLGIKSLRLVSRNGKLAVDRCLLRLKPRCMSFSKANYLLTSSFSSIQKLDCSDNGRQVLKTLLVIAKMKDLQELRVEVSEQSGKRAINAVAKLTNLTRLHFRLAEELPDSVLAGLTRLRQLEVLDLQGATSLCGDGFALLKSLASLRELHLQGCSLIGFTFLGVTCLTQLTRLELGDSLILDQQFELRLDSGMRGPEAMLMRMRAAQMKFGIEIEDEDEFADVLDMSSDEELVEAIGDEAEASLRRDQFTDYLADLPRMSAKFDFRSVTRRDSEDWPRWLTPHLSRLSGLTCLILDDYKMALRQRGFLETRETFYSLFSGLSCIPNLKVLEFRRVQKIEGNFWTPLGKLRNLEKLYVVVDSLQAESFQPVSQLCHLTFLVIHVDGNIEENGLAPIAHLPCLEYLRLSGATCRPGELNSWPSCNIATSLKAFSFQECFANSMRFGPILSSFKGLTSIILSTLHDCTGATARHFESLPDLEQLTIYNCRGVNNDNLRHLQRMTNLKHLNLGKNEIGPSLPCLLDLSQLTFLDLSGSAVSDEGLQSLSHLRNLRELSLAGTDITSAGLLHLSGMTALQDLTLAGCEALVPHETVNSLKSLIVQHSLAKISVDLQLKAAVSRQNLPCQWIPTINLSREECRRYFGHRN